MCVCVIKNNNRCRTSNNGRWGRRRFDAWSARRSVSRRVPGVLQLVVLDVTSRFVFSTPPSQRTGSFKEGTRETALDQAAYERAPALTGQQIHMNRDGGDVGPRARQNKTTENVNKCRDIMRF